MIQLALNNVQRLLVLNRYYKITRFYSFLKNISIKTGIILGIVVGVFIMLDFYLLDLEAIINTIAREYSGWFLFLMLFLSEAIAGILPPELFIAWSSKTNYKWLNLFGLATMSYAGGILAYYLGKLMYLMPSVKNYVEGKVAVHIKNLKRWGGVLVFVGAMLPVPHSLISMACGIIDYKIKYYLVWALFRYVRFFLYALIIYSL
jgi:membrane protein YqaA with SNARE-associated domain